MNSLFQQLQGSQVPEQAVQLANLYKSAQNPQALVNKMMESNPVVKNLVGMMNNGTNMKDLFYSAAKQKGVDPNTIINLLK